MLLSDYVSGVAATDKFASEEFEPIKLGLFGEVGSVMAVAKKAKREKEAFGGYREAVAEEFGDVLWYFTALCRRLNTDVGQVFSVAANDSEYQTVISASDLSFGALSKLATVASVPSLDTALINLGNAVASLLLTPSEPNRDLPRLVAFADCYLHALQASGVSFAEVARANLRKVSGRFVEPSPEALPTFDSQFEEDEQLPAEFEIEIRQRRSEQAFLKMNGVFIGDLLTDNIQDPDGYRFHDVFHFAHAAVLHWSPVFRALLKRKRKSDRAIDEAQDGGRAIVIEEGLTAWIFSRAKSLDFLAGQSQLSFDLLKIVAQFVRGYEVEQCPLALWEKAILQGYAAFRNVKANNGGLIIGSRALRSIEYRSL
jgi:NTP pyrophosphatase (non-canonical NTP hydrolase)